VIIDSYIRLHSRGIQAEKKRKAMVLSSRGKVYDLKKILKELGEKYGLPTRGFKITWTNSRLRRGQQSVRLGSFIRDDRLIRVHPALDDPKIPKYFVEYIIYHELVHSQVKPEYHRHRINFHPADYYELEKKFEHYEKAREFERIFTDKWL
jgi:predicted metal-dependent hydrolase